MDWDRKGKKPLKYSAGDKLMGYQEGDIVRLVAGNIIDIRQSDSYLSDNEYKLQLDHRVVREEEIEEGKKRIIDTWWIEEKEAVPFVEERFARALLLDQRRQTSIKIARQAYTEMLKELYPEQYAEKEEDKGAKA